MFRPGDHHNIQRPIIGGRHLQRERKNRIIQNWGGVEDDMYINKSQIIGSMK